MPFWAWKCQPIWCICSQVPPDGKNPCVGSGYNSGAAIGGPFGTVLECRNFIINSSLCPHCTPTPLGKRVAARLVGYDEGDTLSLDFRPVLEMSCCGTPADTETRLPGRLLGYDEGVQGSGDIRPVHGADLECTPELTFRKVYPARLVGYDHGDDCGLPRRPVYAPMPTCLPPPCCNCGPIVTYGGCGMPRICCLHLRGADSGIVPLQFTSQPTLPIGFTDSHAFCQLSNFWDIGDCAWQGCFKSGVGGTVYVLMAEECEDNNRWNLIFIWKCGSLCGGQWFFTVTGCITNTISPFDPSFGPAPICPGVQGGLFIDFHALSTGPCPGAPGVYWDGFVTDGSCCTSVWNLCQNKATGQLYCTQGPTCGTCDFFVAGPFCSECNCKDLINHL